jgi:FkbM family methyltransferase
MIIDAPMKFPARQSYKLYGETDTSKELQKILEALRPEAGFMGYTDDPSDRGADLLVVCDLSVAGSADLVRQRDADDVVIFPVPIGDMWSYWEFAKVALDRITVGEELSMHAQDFGAILYAMGRVQADPDTGEAVMSKNSYLSSHGDVIGQKKDVVLEVIRGLSDDVSKARYSTLLTGKPEDHWGHYLSRAFQNIQYFDYIDFKCCNTVINGGIFGGYELPFFVTNLPEGATVHNIDPLGHGHLTDYVRPWVDSEIVNFVDHQFALAKENGEIEIAMSFDGQVSTVSNDGRQDTMKKYPARTMDDFVEEMGFESIDLIKLDLEGADRNALVGAVGTLTKYRPQLALSIYHYVPDFWDIPDFVLRILPDYYLYLDFYSYERWETILYAIPKELGARQSNVA